MNRDYFDRNIRAPYMGQLLRIAALRVEDSETPVREQATFEHYDMLGVEFVALFTRNAADDVLLFAPISGDDLRARLEKIPRALP